MKNVIRFLSCLMLVLTLPLIFTSCGKTTVDIEEYITVTFDSYNTMGTAGVNIDYSGLDTLVDSEKVNEYISQFPDGKASIEMGQTFHLSEMFSIKLKENYSGLSNGDKVVVEVGLNSDIASLGETMESMQKALKININVTEVEYTVEGLEEAKILDLITPVTDILSFSGANGNGQVEIVIPADFQKQVGDLILVKGDYTNELEIIKNNVSVGSVTYGFGDWIFTLSGLSSGETIKLLCSEKIDETQVGYDMVLKEKEITVPALGEYVTSKEMLTSELKTEITNSLNKAFANVSNPQIQAYYWGKLKPTVASENPDADAEKLFAYVQYDSFFGTNTFRCEAEIIKKPDNSYSVTWNTVQIYTQETLHNENYDIEKIEF